jgi:hypothetical protein
MFYFNKDRKKKYTKESQYQITIFQAHYYIQSKNQYHAFS